MSKVNYLRAREESLPSGGNPPMAAFTIPVVDGLEVVNLASGGLSLAARNYAPGKPDGSVVGVPVENDRYLYLGPSVWIETGIPEILGGSLMAITRRPPGETPAPIGSVSGTANSGIGIFLTSTHAQLRTETIEGAISTQVAATGNDWMLLLATIPPTGGGFVIKNITTGQQAVSPSTSDRINAIPDTMRVGSLIQTPASWSGDHMLAIASSKVWDSAEQDQMIEWARKYAADFGIVV